MLGKKKFLTKKMVSNLKYRKLIFLAWLSLVSFGVVINIGLAIERRVERPLKQAVASRLLDSDPACPLKCGKNGVCKFRNRDEQTSPACLCDTGYATFPERLCGFETASHLGIDNTTVSTCLLGNHRFYMPLGEW